MVIRDKLMQICEFLLSINHIYRHYDENNFLSNDLFLIEYYFALVLLGLKLKMGVNIH